MNANKQLEALETLEFPLHIFGPEIENSMRFCAKQYNIPPQYVGLTGLFVISSLSGSMYIGEANGGIKTMLYCMMIGPSGVGKTPPYDLLYGNICNETFNKERELWKQEHHLWKLNQRLADKKNEQFSAPEPICNVRMIQNGTPEGMIKKAETSNCGFGIYFDEGGAMKDINKYRGGGSSNDFWNLLWNGKPFHDVKADQDRERYVSNPAMSLMVGIQPDKVKDIITMDAIKSGIAARMLIVESDYIHLEFNDPFGKKVEMCESWKEVVHGLFAYGLKQYTADSKPFKVQFDQQAKIEYTRLNRQLIEESNQRIFMRKGGDESEAYIAYCAKLHQYFSRFCLILAILDNYTGPLITLKHVTNAKLLYDYFAETARIVLRRIFSEHYTGLPEKDQELILRLPDTFTALEAQVLCEKLNLSKKYFSTNFSREKYKGIIGRQNGQKGVYEKLII